MCYMFIKVKTTFENAVKHCGDINAYVLIPSSSSSVEFVRSFINMSGLFVDNIWWSGIMPILYNISYISSNGRLVDVDHLISSNNLPQTHSVLNTDTVTLRANTHSKQQFICQQDKGILPITLLNKHFFLYNLYTTTHVSNCVFENYLCLTSINNLSDKRIKTFYISCTEGN
jgi:hypothetical protein